MGSKKNSTGFSADERAAIKARALELKAEANKQNGEKAVLAAIAKMPEPDRSLAKRIHLLVMKTAPMLTPKTWYGFPAYATAEGKVVCFFQHASKFKYRYSTLGFQEDAKLDDGNMWATSFAVKKITPVEEKRIYSIMKKAIQKNIN